MLRLLLQRLAYALILLGIISVIAFYLSKLVPGDEVLEYLSIDETGYTKSSNIWEQRQAYQRVAEKRGLVYPLFYFTIRPGYYPDSLFSILPAEDRDAYLSWIRTSHNQEGSAQLLTTLNSGLVYSCPQADTSDVSDRICREINRCMATKSLFDIHHQVIKLRQELEGKQLAPQHIAFVDLLNKQVENLVAQQRRLHTSEWLPIVRWNGTANQYHHWMAGLITFKPLTSLIDGRNAWSKITEALTWTLLVNGLAFILAIALGMAIGIWSGTHDGTWMERIIHITLFALFALPSFWLATILIYFFSSGEWLSVFPSGGLGNYDTAANVMQKTGILSEHLFLPVICLALGSLAYVSRQMKQSVMQQLQQPYVFALRTQGISKRTILRKHVFRNALFPMITMIGGSLPALISGSLIIEVIFSIPGMGRLMYNSLLARDWPVVFPILMFAACITVIAYLLTDVIYKWADPRVKTMST
jgi:peptide/nickel transport system permease protein